MTCLRLPSLALAMALFASSGAHTARACACCSNAGQRLIERVALDGGRFDTVRKLRFAADAFLYLGESDADTVRGIATPSSQYALTAAWTGDRLAFVFRDPLGHSGTLALARPRQVAIFEIDPRDSRDDGLGPLLYKEWILSAPAEGSGVFGGGLGPGQTIRLILHGRGRGCTGPEDFTHWTLEVSGPKASYSLFGALAKPSAAANP